MAELTESERENIEKQAKKILEDFSKSLDSVKFKTQKTQKSDSLGFREEGEGTRTQSDFKRMMFDNAISKNEDNIIAETKKW